VPNMGRMLTCCNPGQKFSAVMNTDLNNHTAAELDPSRWLEEYGDTLFRYALGDTQGTAQIHVTARSDSSSLLEPALQDSVFPGTAETGQQPVSVARLHDLLPSEKIVAPAMLKIDVQGFEGEVLKGCAAQLRQFDWIYCELSFVELYTAQPLAHDIIRILDTAGFILDGVYMDDMSYKDGRAIQGDFLFRRKEIAEAR